MGKLISNFFEILLPENIPSIYVLDREKTHSLSQKAIFQKINSESAITFSNNNETRKLDGTNPTYFSWLLSKFLFRHLSQNDSFFDINKFNKQYTIRASKLIQENEFSILRRCTSKIIFFDSLDGFLSTIRKQKLSFVKPPKSLSDIDTIINSKTLSFKINEWSNGNQLTLQEMNIALRRLKDEDFETLEDVNNLLFDGTIKKQIENLKEELGNTENVLPFEMIMYGTLLQRGKKEIVQSEIKKDLGFVKHKCLTQECGKYLTEKEYEFIVNKTDSDFDFYCEEHRLLHFTNTCTSCSRHTTKDLCLECEAKENDFL